MNSPTAPQLLLRRSRSPPARPTAVVHRKGGAKGDRPRGRCRRTQPLPTTPPTQQRCCAGPPGPDDAAKDRIAHCHTVDAGASCPDVHHFAASGPWGGLDRVRDRQMHLLGCDERMWVNWHSRARCRPLGKTCGPACRGLTDVTRCRRDHVEWRKFVDASSPLCWRVIRSRPARRGGNRRACPVRGEVWTTRAHGESP